MKSATQTTREAPLASAERTPPDFERECADFFAEVVTVFGAPPSVGQIYGVVFASPSPLSFTDIVERLDISKGSASQGIKLLRELGAVRSAEVADDRREYFVAELGLRRLVDGAVRERIGNLVAAAPNRISRLRRLAEQGGAARDSCIDQVEQLETWRRKLKLALPVLSMLLGPPKRRR
jgi:DNA-binding transcriptional regulator GbsR (MarR family)